MIPHISIDEYQRQLEAAVDKGRKAEPGSKARAEAIAEICRLMRSGPGDAINLITRKPR